MFTWKVGVEVLALLHVDPSRGIAVPVQEVVDVILTPVPGGFRLTKVGKNPAHLPKAMKERSGGMAPLLA